MQGKFVGERHLGVVYHDPITGLPKLVRSSKNINFVERVVLGGAETEVGERKASFNADYG